MTKIFEPAVATVNSTDVANSPAIWILAAISVAVIIFETLLFLRLAKNAVKEKKVNITPKDANKALKAGAIAAIGPALGMFVVMIGLMAIIGSPMSWLRLSVLGGATTELAGATVGVTTAGGDITQELSMMEMSTAWWTMTVSVYGWMFMSWLLLPRMDKVRNKIGGGDTRWVGVLSIAASLGLFGVFTSEFLIIGLQTVDWGLVTAVIVAIVAMLGLMSLSKRFKWLNEYCLGFALIIAVAAGIIVG